jgi:predicted Rossmann fold flavoprotein
VRCDVAIVGAGAAGLHCAAICGQLGCSVVLIDHAAKLAEKIRISGGGRCNFTNVHTGPGNFESANPDFCRSALARYSPRDFIDLVERHGIAWHEKHRGQLFCDGSSAAIIQMLVAECEAGGVERWQPCRVDIVRKDGDAFALETTRGTLRASRVVVATGGLSIPKIGATDWGYVLARRFGHRIVEPRPALVPFVCDGADWQPFAGLAGVALPVRARALQSGAPEFAEDLLFTHRGLSGPAALQISTWWRAGEAIAIDLAPEGDLARTLIAEKSGRRHVGSVLADVLAEAARRRLGRRGARRRSAGGGGPRPRARSARRRPAPLDAGTFGHRRLEEGRGHRRRRRHPRPRLAELREPARPGTPLHRRSRRRHRLARRLQLPVGVGERRRLRPRHRSGLPGEPARAIIVVFAKISQS